MGNIIDTKFDNFKKPEKFSSGLNEESKFGQEQKEQQEQSGGVREKAKVIGEKINEIATVPSGQSIAVDADSDFIRQEQKKIEKILEEDLADFYLKMSPKEQQEFIAKGEETAHKIIILIKQGKAKLGKIIGLIKSWLKMIPKVNEFFIEQMTKIKIDKINNLIKKDHLNE